MKWRASPRFTYVPPAPTGPSPRTPRCTHRAQSHLICIHLPSPSRLPGSRFRPASAEAIASRNPRTVHDTAQPLRSSAASNMATRVLRSGADDATQRATSASRRPPTTAPIQADDDNIDPRRAGEATRAGRLSSSSPARTWRPARHSLRQSPRRARTWRCSEEAGAVDGARGPRGRGPCVRPGARDARPARQDKAARLTAPRRVQALSCAVRTASER